jgi:hypothetical protein
MPPNLEEFINWLRSSHAGHLSVLTCWDSFLSPIRCRNAGENDHRSSRNELLLTQNRRLPSLSLQLVLESEQRAHRIIVVSRGESFVAHS